MQGSIFDTKKITNLDRAVLNYLRAKGKYGATNKELSNIALSYTKAISNLRAAQYDIERKRVYRNGKATGTHLYYYTPEREYSNEG